MSRKEQSQASASLAIASTIKGPHVPISQAPGSDRKMNIARRVIRLGSAPLAAVAFITIIETRIQGNDDRQKARDVPTRRHTNFANHLPMVALIRVNSCNSCLKSYSRYSGQIGE